MRRLALFSVWLLVLAVPSIAAADDAGTLGSIGGCTEHLPEGMERPKLTETFPSRGTSGYAASLVVTIPHKKGEHVLSADRLAMGTTSTVELKASHFVLPDQDGGARIQIRSKEEGDQIIDTVEWQFVPLPEKGGRNLMELPRIPFGLSRANGAIATLCTAPHSIIVEDPIASANDPKPEPNPDPLTQREEWTALKQALQYGSLGLLFGALLAYAAWKWWKRPPPPVPPPPPRPPWDVALEQLDEVRHAGLLEAGRHGEYFDRVSDAVRRYLGARFDFDGLESTTDEILTHLQRTGAVSSVMPEVTTFLGECDLVKFANMTPTEQGCKDALTIGEAIVKRTMPTGPRAFAPAPERATHDDQAGSP